MTPDATRLRRIRWAVRATLTLGVAASVVANVLHARDTPIAQAIAAWPPLALLLTVELISRVPVHRRLLAAARMLATGTIAGIAAWVSYWHMAGVAARYGETSTAAHLIPLSVDGLVVVASVSLVELASLARAVGLPTTAPAAEPTKPQPAQPTRALVSLVKPTRRIVIAVQPGARATDSSDQRRLYALAQLATGRWDVEQSATHAGVSVRRFQGWADEVAAKTRRPRGGVRKPTPEPADRELAGVGARAASDFPADAARAGES